VGLFLWYELCGVNSVGNLFRRGPWRWSSFDKNHERAQFCSVGERTSVDLVMIDGFHELTELKSCPIPQVNYFSNSEKDRPGLGQGLLQYV
jgi:hypothetical protein